MKGDKDLFNSIFAHPDLLKWGPFTMKISPPLPSTATNMSNVEDDSLISRHYRTFLWNEITKEIKLGKGKVKKTETVCSSSKTKRICRSSKT